MRVDVNTAEDIARLNETTLGRFGGIDVWNNIVGVGALWFVWEIPIEDEARLVDANLKDLLRGARAVMKQSVFNVYRAQADGPRA